MSLSGGFVVHPVGISSCGRMDIRNVDVLNDSRDSVVTQRNISAAVEMNQIKV
jgi:hypothetical protein